MADPTRAPTIIDVAEKAGVAVGTVSRFLNGEAVRAANRDVIERAIADLGFRRNATAVAMKTDVTRIVGFMAPSLGEFHAGILDRLTRQMRLSGRAVLSFCHDLQPRSIREGLDFFAAHRVDAVVMDGEEIVRQDLTAYLDRGPTFIFYDNDLPGFPADRVFVDNRGASARAVNHLLQLGHQRIAVVHGNLRDATARDRLQGYRDALTAHGLTPDPQLCHNADWAEHGGFEAASNFMALPEPPTAIYSCNYNMTLGILAYLHQNAIRVAEDLSLISFDDVPALRLHQPGITAVGQPIDRIADTIANLIEARLGAPGQPGKREIRLDCDIILRGSTQRPR
jgi:LacI family transcriptional regulator